MTTDKAIIKMGSISDSVFIAEGAVIRGNVSIKDSSSVWFNAVIRTEGNPITIGRNSNVQDNCVLHNDPFTSITIGDNVTIGHGAIIHGCTIGNNVIVGMGAIVMNNAVIGDNCIIGAGALVTENVRIPSNSLVVGSPGRVKRELQEKEAEYILTNAAHYSDMANVYR